MGRFFRTSRPEFLQGVVYQPPVQLMIQAIQNDNQVRALYEQQSDQLKQSLLTQPHLKFDKGLLEAIQNKYNGSIDEITRAIYEDPNILGKIKPKMRQLQSQLLMDKLNGDLGNIANRYNAFAKFQEENKDVKDADPTTYNLALSYELNKLKEATEKDKSATFTPYKIIKSPNWKKDFNELVTKLKVSSREVPDGRGYLVKIKNLPKERIIELALGELLSRSEYREYARQQSMYGVPGFINEDGTMIAPYAIMDSTGKQYKQSELENLTPEQAQSLGIHRGLNPYWRFSQEITHLANAHSYQEQEMKSDSTWAAKMQEQGRNNRHAQDLRVKLELERMRGEREMLKQAMKSNARSAGNPMNGKGLKEREINENSGKSFETGATVSERQFRGQVSLSDDLESLNNSPSSNARLNKVFENISSNGYVRSRNEDSIPLEEFAITALQNKINFKNSDSESARDFIRRKIEEKIKERDSDKAEFYKVGNRTLLIPPFPKRENYTDEEEYRKDMNKYNAEVQYYTKLVHEDLSKNVSPIIDSTYNTFNTMEHRVASYGLSDNGLRNLWQILIDNPNSIRMTDEKGNQIPQEEVKNKLLQAYGEDGYSYVNARYLPKGTSINGGVLQVQLDNEVYFLTGTDINKIISKAGNILQGDPYQDPQFKYDLAASQSPIYQIMHYQGSLNFNTPAKLKNLSPYYGYNIDQVFDYIKHTPSGVEFKLKGEEVKTISYQDIGANDSDSKAQTIEKIIKHFNPNNIQKQ